jgi:Kef-type K+ transport system membrane component KefB
MAVVLVAGHWLGPRLLPRLKRLSSWPAPFIAVTSPLILLAASLTETLGPHAFLGVFLAGAALGSDNGEEKNEANEAITHFAFSFFTPLYFVSMGLHVNFVAHFDALLVEVIVLLACVSKIGAVLLAMILADVGLDHGLLDERLFVAMVMMALITSLMSGPMIKWLLATEHTPHAKPA